MHTFMQFYASARSSYFSLKNQGNPVPSTHLPDLIWKQ